MEKGWADVSLTVTGEPGHSSVPPKETTIGILAKAITNLEEKQHPTRFGSSVEYDTMKYVAPYASFGYKLILGNLWLFGSVVSSVSIHHSMAIANLKKNEEFVTNTTAASKYIPRRPRISIN